MLHILPCLQAAYRTNVRNAEGCHRLALWLRTDMTYESSPSTRGHHCAVAGPVQDARAQMWLIYTTRLCFICG